MPASWFVSAGGVLALVSLSVCIRMLGLRVEWSQQDWEEADKARGTDGWQARGNGDSRLTGWVSKGEGGWFALISCGHFLIHYYIGKL